MASALPIALPPAAAAAARTNERRVWPDDMPEVYTQRTIVETGARQRSIGPDSIHLLSELWLKVACQLADCVDRRGAILENELLGNKTVRSPTRWRERGRAGRVSGGHGIRARVQRRQIWRAHLLGHRRHSLWREGAGDIRAEGRQLHELRLLSDGSDRGRRDFQASAGGVTMTSSESRRDPLRRLGGRDYGVDFELNKIAPVRHPLVEQGGIAGFH